LLRQTEQQVGERRAGGRSSANGAAGAWLLGVETGEGIGAGEVAGIAKEVVMYAAKISAKAEVVLFVDPRALVRRGDRLVGLEVRLLLVDAGELVQGDVGQTLEQGVGGQPA
jgi:hypothetical protein